MRNRSIECAKTAGLFRNQVTMKLREHMSAGKQVKFYITEIAKKPRLYIITKLLDY